MFEIINKEHTPKVPFLKDVPKWIEDNQELLHAYIKFASSLTNATGLAANQCAFNGDRIESRFLAIIKEGQWILAINPRVRKHLGEQHQKIEGCLTWGADKIIIANRFDSIDIDYHTIDGIYIKERISDDFEAQVWQHEVNHLDGVQEVVLDKAPAQFKRANKIGRNDPCPCGSGKKYKKCHLGLEISEFLV